MKTIHFGNYWQSNDVDKEPIEWLVLKEEEDRMYVLSKYCLDCVPYKDGRKTTWKNSFMRKWLNTEFLSSAFSAEEQDRILLSDVKTDYCRPGPNCLDVYHAVQDKVFIPSHAEAILYFGSIEYDDNIAAGKRIAMPTMYAYKKGCLTYRSWHAARSHDGSYPKPVDASTPESDKYWRLEQGIIRRFQFGDPLDYDVTETRWGCEWYLRISHRWVSKVYADGTLYEDRINGLGVGVRPAMWIKK